MKLAEALAQRADLSKRLEQIKTRAVRNAKVQDGDIPAEEPTALINEFEAAAGDLATLITRINLTNATTMLGESTITAALARRDVLKLRQAFYRELAAAAVVTQTVSTRSEIRFRSTVPVAAIQKTADHFAQELRRLDTQIQEANWLTILKE